MLVNICVKASSADGNIIIVLDADEWKHMPDTCYMSIYGFSIPEVSLDASVTNIVFASPNTRIENSKNEQLPNNLPLKISSWWKDDLLSLSAENLKGYVVSY
jgi:hypothetical protein